MEWILLFGLIASGCLATVLALDNRTLRQTVRDQERELAALDVALKYATHSADEWEKAYRAWKMRP